MTEIQDSKPSQHLEKKNFKYVWVIEYWNLRFICNLVLGIWDFSTFYELQLTLIHFWTAEEVTHED